MYRVLSVWDRVCIDKHYTQYTIHDVFVYRVPNCGTYRAGVVRDEREEDSRLTRPIRTPTPRRNRGSHQVTLRRCQNARTFVPANRGRHVHE